MLSDFAIRSENDYRCHLNFFKLSKIKAASCCCRTQVARVFSKSVFRERGSLSRIVLLVNLPKLLFLKFQNQWRRSGSNRQPPPCKGGALPVELRPRILGVRGLEPRTSALSELRSNHLSYTPELRIEFGSGIVSMQYPIVQPDRPDHRKKESGDSEQCVHRSIGHRD